MYWQTSCPTSHFLVGPPGNVSLTVPDELPPLVGTILIAEGVVKVGGEFLDPERRYTLWVRIMTGAMKNHVVVCG
ncbi:MAG: hypothetical protein HOO96_14690, partial [Polyangiaceae bacterium]|nr:hypothetical protein [Polyangiaceae bacterium]